MALTKQEVLQAMAYFKTLMDEYNDDTFARKGEITSDGNISALESKVDDIESAISDLQNEIASGTISALESKVDDIESAISDLQNEIASGTSGGADTSELKSKLDNLESDVETLKNLLELDSDIDDLKNKISELENHTDDETITRADVEALFA